jgi:hypothetical protein
MAPHPIEVIRSNKDRIIELLKTLINRDKEFDDAITTRTSDRQKMEYRVHTFATRLAELVRG